MAIQVFFTRMQEQPFCYSCSLWHNTFGNMFLHNTVGNNVFCITGERTEKLTLPALCHQKITSWTGNIFVFTGSVQQEATASYHRIWHACSTKYTEHIQWRVPGSSSAIIQHTILEINLPTIKGNKSSSKTFNSIMIHAKYKPTNCNSSNLIQTADTFQIINFIQQIILFGIPLLYNFCVVHYSLHEIFFYQDIIN